MSEFSDYLCKELLDHTFAKAAYGAPTTHYLCLLTAAGLDTQLTKAALPEESGGGYAAAAIAFDAATGTGTAVISDNTAAITFTNTGTPNWVVTGIAICDGNATSSNVLCYDNGMTTATIAQTEKLQFAAGDIDINLD